MTKEEALENLSNRALNVNLYIGEKNGCPYVLTGHGLEEILEFQRHYGGNRYNYNSETNLDPPDRWRVMGDQCLAVLRDLIKLTSFKKSGKWHYAYIILKKYDKDHGDA